MDYDFSDSKVRVMVENNHNPMEFVGSSELAVVCNFCEQEWPCPAIKGLRKYWAKEAARREEKLKEAMERALEKAMKKPPIPLPFTWPPYQARWNYAGPIWIDPRYPMYTYSRNY